MKLRKILSITVFSLALGLSGCAVVGSEESKTAQTSQAATPTPTATPTTEEESLQPLNIDVHHALTDKKMATFSFKERGTTTCNGKEMTELVFDITVPDDKMAVMYYDAYRWKMFIPNNGGASDISREVLTCIPEDSRSVHVSAGQTAKDITVIFDTSSYEGAFYDAPYLDKSLSLGF